jgi:type IV secretion system protein VirB6
MLSYCPAGATPDEFLTNALAYLDCQARSIGSYGYEAISGSTAGGAALLALLTVFVALFGVRMMFGHLPHMRELAVAIAKVGIVLMLVTSWPAVRTLFFDTAVSGPSEIASRIIGGPEAGGAGVIQRLQNVDNAIVRLTAFGTGRNDESGGLAAEAFRGVALTDALAMGGARYAWLAGALAALGTVRLAAGILIALLPLFAGFLLFSATRGLFVGWLRTLLALILANATVLVVLAVELAFLEPWLQQMLAQRAAYVATPSAPTELLVITSAFTLVTAALILMLFRLCFGHFPAVGRAGLKSDSVPAAAAAAHTTLSQISSAVTVSALGAGASREMILASAIRRGERHVAGSSQMAALLPQGSAQAAPVTVAGDAHFQHARRTAPRTARSRLRRDKVK